MSKSRNRVTSTPHEWDSRDTPNIPASVLVARSVAAFLQRAPPRCKRVNAAYEPIKTTRWEYCMSTQKIEGERRGPYAAIHLQHDMVLNSHGACVTSMGLTSLNGAHNNGL